MAPSHKPRGYFAALFRPVAREHIEAACQRAIQEGAPPQRAGRSAFVPFDGTLLPAKHIVGLAYQLATGRTLSPEAYHGGAGAAGILDRLGLQTVTRHRSHRPRSATGRRRVFVTVSVEGSPAHARSQNPARLTLMRTVLERIRVAGWNPEIVLFPGGFFWCPYHLGPLDEHRRRRRLQGLSLSHICTTLARENHTVLVAGIDGKEWTRPGWPEPDWGDQLCVAWTGRGIVGIGRKIFPVPGEESESYTVYRSDFGSVQRRPRFPHGRTALLCSCYDMFGCSELPNSPTKRTRAIQWLGTGKETLWERAKSGAKMASLLREDITRWRALVRSADVGLAAVHYFAKRGEGSGKSYWQRHGVERASKQIRGRLAFGAAHFAPPLPAPRVAVLAAKSGRRLHPAGSFEVCIPGGQAALVRRFDVNKP